ncbi:hypothetical protein Acy02nite_31450 [Actinoplanes cyaneus]|uniref:Uncharacterized protein n=1 Tax=Actinoplanes cyaneus TaxID=52696 RepID=A0A919IGI4_9ACTN|nr:hypothetical protein [Actinoplanes cyaneus]MCW2142456.1 hypothetical protein [Actinoplanes cyaneus]GID65264.1 hypothetical protein Acy02nite_31450 [Actinoplanes cyaneus]
MAPFDKHSANTGEIEARAADFERLAGKALDLRTVTDKAFQPAEADWDGMCAEELKAAPEPVRRAAQETSSALAWVAAPLRYWEGRVTAFNAAVDRIAGALDGAAKDDFGATGPAGTAPTSQQVADARSEAMADARRQWWVAYNTDIVEGSSTAAGMLRDGPTEVNLKAARDAGALPVTPGVFTVFPAYWHTVNMEAAAGRADELAKKIKDPTYVPTAAELEELRNLVRDYGKDKVFAYNFLDDLGPKGLLELNGTLATYQLDNPGKDVSDGVVFDAGTADLVRDLQIGLGVALATATKTTGTRSGPRGENYYPGKYELSSQWTTDLMIAGRQKMTIGDPGSVARYAEGVYGYQLLGPLLRNGDYDARFLALVGGDIVDFEMSQGKNSALWTEARGENLRLDWTQGYEDNTVPAGYDPVNALMDQLARNGEGTRDLLTDLSTYTTDGPKDGRLPRLDYLLTDRNWDATADTPGGPGWQRELLEHKDDYKNTALDKFGTALEEATVHESTPESRRIVASIIHEVNVDEQAQGYANGEDPGTGGKAADFAATDLINPDLRDSLGKITAAYITDVNLNISDGHPVDESTHFSVEKQEYVVRFLADLGKDEGARADITGAEAVYAAHEYHEILSGNRTPGDGIDGYLRGMEVVSQNYGSVVGALDVGATSAHNVTSAEQDAKFNEGVEKRYAIIGKVVDELVGKATEKIPVPFVGDFIGEKAGDLVSDAEDEAKQDNGGRTAFENGVTLGAGRHDAVDIAELSLYKSGKLENLPAVLLVNGEPKPIDEWSERDQQAWNRYKAEYGQSTVGNAAKNAGNSYQAGYDWASKIANGGSDAPKGGN